MRGNSVNLKHWSVFRSREHFQSHRQWALFASKERQTMKWEMGQTHVGKQQSFSLLDAVFASTPVKMKFFCVLMVQPEKWQQWFFRHLPQREVSQAKALVLPEGSAGVWRLVSGISSLAKIWSVSCLRGVHCRGAQKFLQSWIHLHRAETADQRTQSQILERGTVWGPKADPCPSGGCSFLKSAINHPELPLPAPKSPNYVCAEGWQGREREGSFVLTPGCLHPFRWRVDFLHMCVL